MEPPKGYEPPGGPRGSKRPPGGPQEAWLTIMLLGLFSNLEFLEISMLACFKLLIMGVLIAEYLFMLREIKYRRLSVFEFLIS